MTWWQWYGDHISSPTSKENITIIIIITMSQDLFSSLLLLLT